MADTTTDTTTDTASARPLTHTRLAQERGPVGHHPGSGGPGGLLATASVVTGVLGIAAGLIPGLWIVALVLAVIALATGVATLRRGRDGGGYRAARIGVVLGVVALALGLMNLGIWYDEFDYFFSPD